MWGELSLQEGLSKEPIRIVQLEMLVYLVKVKFMDHVIFGDSIIMDHSMVEAVLDWKFPTTVMEIKVSSAGQVIKGES